MKKFNWYFRQKVTSDEMKDFQDAPDEFVKQLTADLLGNGFSEAGEVVENDPTADFTVDVRPIGSGQIRGRTSDGERIMIPSKQDVDCSVDEASNPVTLPGAGNEKYITVLVGFGRFESDARIDGNGLPVNYLLEDGWEFTVIQGSEDTIGAAVVPSDPEDGRLILCDILLGEATTTITNSMIDLTRMKIVPTFLEHRHLGGNYPPQIQLQNEIDQTQGDTGRLPVLNAPLGTDKDGFTTRYNETSGTPSNGQDYEILVTNRGANPAFKFVVEEDDVDASANPPTIKFTDFSDSSSFSLSQIGRRLTAGSNIAFSPNGDGTYEISASTGAAGWLDAGSYVRTLDVIDSVIIGSLSAPDASAKFQIDSTDSGVLFPRMTTAQRDLIASPATSLIIFNTTTGQHEFWNGSAWTAIGGVGSGEANTASNLGAGEGIFTSKSGVDLPFKSLVGGTLVSLSSDANEITISTTAQNNTASNVGTGLGVFKQKTSSDLQFKTLSNTGGVTFSVDGADAIQANVTSIPSSALPDGQIKTLSITTAIDGTSSGSVLLHTGSVGKNTIVTGAYFMITTATGLTGTIECSIGSNATEYDDILNEMDFTNFDSIDDVFHQEVNLGISKLIGAGTEIRLDIDTPFGGTTVELTVILLGIEI